MFNYLMKGGKARTSKPTYKTKAFLLCVARYLAAHPSNEQHLLARLRMEGRIIEMLGAPELLNPQIGRVFSIPKEKR